MTQTEIENYRRIIRYLLDVDDVEQADLFRRILENLEATSRKGEAI